MTVDTHAEERLQRYLADLVMTATPVQRLLMLFDHLRRDLAGAAHGFENGDIKAVSDGLVHAQHILFALRDPLDRGSELGKSLAAVYDFCLDRLLSCNLQKDPTLLVAVRELVDQVASANATAAASAGAGAEKAAAHA